MRLPIEPLVVTIACALIACLDPQVSSGQGIAWQRVVRTDYDDKAWDVDVDGLGNAIVVGVTSGNSGSELGSVDGLVAKWNSSGQLIWSRGLGTPDADVFYSVATDRMGSIYAGGFSEGLFGSAQFGRRDAVIAKLDAHGETVWRKQFGAQSDDRITALAASEAMVVAAGATNSELVPGQRVGSTDAFIKAVDSTGADLWAYQFGSADIDRSTGVAIDRDRNVYMLGTVWPGSWRETFLRKYDADGDLKWERNYFASRHVEGLALALDASGNALIAGATDASFSGMNNGDFDAFVMKITPDGEESWRHQFGTAEYDIVEGISFDSEGRILVAGTTQGPIDGTEARGVSDSFVAAFDTEGAQLWSRNIGAARPDVATSITADEIGNTYVVGMISGSGFRDDIYVASLGVSVPEPSGWATVAAGFLGFGGWRRRWSRIVARLALRQGGR